MIFERRDFSRLVGLDVKYFLFLSRDEIQRVFSGFVTYIVTAMAMVM